MVGAMVLIALGIWILLGAFGVVPITLWNILIWIIAVGVGAFGVYTLIRSFPNGLTTTFAGILLILILFKVVHIGFWSFVAIIIGVYLIQLGFYGIMRKNPWKMFRRDRW